MQKFQISIIKLFAVIPSLTSSAFLFKGAQTFQTQPPVNHWGNKFFIYFHLKNSLPKFMCMVSTPARLTGQVKLRAAHASSPLSKQDLQRNNGEYCVSIITQWKAECKVLLFAHVYLYWRQACSKGWKLKQIWDWVCFWKYVISYVLSNYCLQASIKRSHYLRNEEFPVSSQMHQRDKQSCNILSSALSNCEIYRE